MALTEGPTGVGHLLLRLEIRLVHDSVANAQPTVSELRLPPVRGPAELTATQAVRVRRVIARAGAQGLRRLIEFETSALDQDYASTYSLEFTGECQPCGTRTEDANVCLEILDAL